MVLNDDAVHSDQTGGGKLESAGSCKTVPLAFLSEDWIRIPKQSSRRLPPVVKAAVQIFSSRTDLPQSLFFPYCLLSPKDYIFRHRLCSKWKQQVLTSQPGHTVVTALWVAFRSQRKQLLEKRPHQVLQPPIPYV